MIEDGFWIKRTTQEDIDHVMTHGNSLGSLGSVEVYPEEVPKLTAAQVAEQFGRVFPQYDFGTTDGGGSSMVHGWCGDLTHTVYTDYIVKGLWEVKRRLDFDKGRSFG